MGKTINGATLRKMFANAFSLVEEKKKDIDALNVFLAGLHDVAQILVFLGELHVALLVADDVRVGDKSRYFFESCHQSFQFF